MISRYSWSRLFCVATALLFSCAALSAQINLTINSTGGSYSSEVGWQIVNTATGATVHCRPQAAAVPTGVVISVPAGTYEVRAFDSWGDTWNGATLTVLYTTSGQILVNGITYSGTVRQTMTCPGPTAITNTGQIIATFSVVAPCFAPTITAQPVSQTICSGQPITFSVGSTLTNGTFEWFRDTVSLGVSTSSVLTIPNAQQNNAGLYRCVLRDNCNPATATTTTAIARLTVVASPAITQNLPATRSVCENANDTLRIRATGAGRTFQWFRDGVAILGATDSNLVINNAQVASSGQYSCTVSGTCTPSVTSTTTSFVVAARPRITSEPNNLDLCPGAAGSISVAATGANLTYQWFKDGVAVPGGFNATLAFPSYDYASNGLYYCMVTSNVANPNNCNIRAQSRTVRVSGFRAPVVKTQPVAKIDACVGTAANVLVQFSGTGLTYEWYKDGNLISNNNSNELVIANVTPAAAGKYVVVATGTCGLKTASDTVSITVLSKPSISKQPEGAKLTVGNRLDLSVEATDIRSIQWMKNEVAIPGATTANFSIASVVKSDAGFYAARVTNSCGGVVTNYAKVEVNDPVAPRPAIELGQVSADFGEIPVGYDKTITLDNLIKNVGNAPLTVTALNIAPSDFTVSNSPALPFDIAPGASQTITVKAAPTAKGPIFGTLTILSNAPLTPQASVALSAAYVLRYGHPAGQEFGLLETGKSVDKCVTITNTSTQDISIDQATVIGMNASEFTVTTSMPLAVAAGASAEICVKFAPGTAGKKSAQLSLRSSNGGNSTIDLSGSGEVPGGVIDAAEAGISVWPNPVRETVTINFGKPLAGMNISVVSSAGQVVAAMSHDGVDGGTAVMLNIGSQVASGAYSLIIRSGGDVMSLPITVIK
jgi:hypothetical protein